MPVNQSPHGVILSGKTQGYEPALTHRFVLRFTRAPNGAGTWSEAMGYAVRSFSPGKKIIEIAQYQLQNRTIQYPLKRAALPSANLDLIIYGGKSNGAYDFFWKWFKLVYNDEEDSVGLLGNVANSIGGTAEIDLVGGPNADVIATVTLDDLWPNTFGTIDLNRRDEAEAVIAQVSFVVNDYEWKYSAGATGGG